jgi:polyhydroxyalkanoate synthase
VTDAAASALAARLAESLRLFSDLTDEDVAIATTPRDVVFRQDKVTLWRFRPLAPPTIRVPLLICFGLIGRWTMADLEPDRSLVRRLLQRGIDLYVVEWGDPGRAERYLTLDDYIDGYLDACIRTIAGVHGTEAIGLLGICEGGVLSACYTALHPERVRALALSVTPIDFHAEPDSKSDRGGYLNLWARTLAPETIDRLVEAHGALPGELMGGVFSMLTPMRALTRHGLEMLEAAADRARLQTFLRMERWLADQPDHPGEAAKQWLKWLYQENRLARGTFRIGGRVVDLSRIECPVLNVFGADDRIVPPETARALSPLVGTRDYTELAIPGGHIGIFVGTRGAAILGPAIADWLADRDGGQPSEILRSAPEATRRKTRRARTRRDVEP